MAFLMHCQGGRSSTPRRKGSTMKALNGARYLVRLLVERGNEFPPWWNVRGSQAKPDLEEEPARTRPSRGSEPPDPPDLLPG